MHDVAPASELERRKQLRLRLRRDLAVEAQKYEGRTYYVVKDPVSLRYYRMKDYEHFLLQYMDGDQTLEDAQKAYEKHYRPDRLKLEDLESFGQQLLNAGLAHNESPRAGKQLFDRRKKRRRSELMQTFTNILYIKIPIIDPDRLLRAMLPWLGWIFSPLFFALSVGFMLSAALLVATNFEMFMSKLPAYHEFFSFKTVVYLWAALGVVKVIHEFGHGLSCKKFGGEVHEMGALFLCFSPALYCNVSDAWTLPNKWHRIIISAAGIYVELIIAALATWIWWYSASQPFLNNLALSLMVVCSVSTVVFNANPLMRYDGYYVLQPYGLEPISRMLAVAAGASMIGWPIYRLGKNIYKRGRLPDMKRWRVVTTASIIGAILLFVCLVPLPINRVGGRGLVQPMPDATDKMFVRHPGRLEKLYIHPGQHVEAGEEVAVFRNPELESDLAKAKADLHAYGQEVESLVGAKSTEPLDREETAKNARELRRVDGLRCDAAAKVQSLLSIQSQDLVLKAPRAGVVGQAPPVEAVGKWFDKSSEQIFCTISEPRKFRVCLPVTTHDFNRLREDLERASPAATETRRLLSGRVAAHYKETRLADVFADLRKQAYGLNVDVDDAAGASVDSPVTFAAENQRLATVLDDVLRPLGLGYVVVSASGRPNDGRIVVRPGRERGYPEGPRPVADLGVAVCIHGRDDRTFVGLLAPLPESEAKEVPLPLTSRAGGPVAVKAKPNGAGTLVPQAQQYLVYIDVLDADDAVADGAMAEVKINCRPETCLQWVWRTLHNTFDLRLL